MVEKRAQLDRILQACLGLEVQTTISQAEVVPGEKMKLHHSAVIHSSIPVRWVAVRYPAIKREIDQKIDLLPNQSRSLDSTQTLPARHAVKPALLAARRRHCGNVPGG